MNDERRKILLRALADRAAQAGYELTGWAPSVRVRENSGVIEGELLAHGGMQLTPRETFTVRLHTDREQRG